MKYLTGCAHYFRSGHIDVMQFTLVKSHHHQTPRHPQIPKPQETPF
jgi:hypothetical protein